MTTEEELELIGALIDLGPEGREELELNSARIDEWERQLLHLGWRDL